MEYQSELPLFYKKPVPLNSEVHALTRIGKSPGGFAFAASAHSVMLAGVEFAEACRFFPILFSSLGNGAVAPVALLGLQSGENMFVGAAGEWLAEYVPAYVRRYPFITTSGDGAPQTVCFDELCEGVNVEEGELLFLNGEQTPYLQGVLRFLTDYTAQINSTEVVCRQISDKGLLKPMTLNVQLNDGRKLSLTDFQVVDEQKLNELDKDALDEIFRSGALAMIYFHLVSMRAIAGMVNRKNATQA